MLYWTYVPGGQDSAYVVSWRARKLMDKALLDSTPEHEAAASWRKSLEILSAESAAPTPRAVAKMAKGNPAVDRLVFELESPKLKAITS